MALAYINLSATQYFNFMCKTDFERRIFHDTYEEFQKKSKIYNPDNSLHTFAQMENASEKAKLLHQKLHYSAMNTIASLNNKMPILNDEAGKSILFDLADLKIFASDLKNKAGHVVSITYTSSKLLLHEIVGDMLIVSYDFRDDFNETFMVRMTNDLVIKYEKNKVLVYD
ncbi:hypothetical protein QWY86_12330 [Pedobacter aquatilis]|uniref:hypothetical protein n=1 Tax=Pedobacter aquatilis TaxID=351343 RepID=UPI0025B5D6BE|nr:hypothetical protein [Pedobacter aquatilis]MDN3587463.1 hypothetical protein [Pedobacter aquatilis]